MPKTGQCLCGEVKFEAEPKIGEVGVCHCGMCRKGTAGPYFAVDCGDTLKFEDETRLGVYASSVWAERVFCKTCGSPIVWRTKDRRLNVVSVNTFDDVSELILDHEIFIDEKPNYYSFEQKTRQMTGAQVFEMFAAEQEN